jgi:hypothetical protein
VRGADDAEGGAVADARQASGVAVGEHPGPGRHELDAVRADGAAGGHLRRGQIVRGDHRIGGRERPLDAPRQVHRGGPGRLEARPCGLRVLAPGPGERHAHRAGDAEGGRATDREVADALGQLGDRGDVDDAQLARQQALVDQPDVAVHPLDGRRDGIDAGGASGRTAHCGIRNGGLPPSMMASARARTR